MRTQPCPLRIGFRFLFALLMPAISLGQLRLNEIVADNDGSFLDADGEASDWVEIHNPGASPASTAGLYLTDNPSNPTKWALPALIIPSGGYLVVFASGKDRADSADDLHANFSLAAGGEYLALISADGFTPLSEFAPKLPNQFFGVAYGVGSNAPVEETTFVPWPASATWTVPTTDIGNAWQETGFDDSSWNQAQTGIGFGYSFPGFIGPGGDTRNAMFSIASSAYIRIPFEIEDPGEVITMNLELFYEDGFAAYLNGELVASAKTPPNLTFNSGATEQREIQEDDMMDRFSLDFAGKLRAGQNILAFQMLNRSTRSSDVLLVPRLFGETQALADNLPAGYLEDPTPGAPNAPIEFIDLVKDTTFDVDRGFFETPFNVNITSETLGASIIYTTDGSDPTPSNGTVVAPPSSDQPPTATVNISTTTVLRAAAFKSGLRPTNIDTQTYLFLDDVLNQPAQPPGYPLPWRARNGNTIPGDFEMDPQVVGSIYSREELKEALRDIPTISIATEIGNLFDQQTGIQVNPQDSGEASERPVSVEVLDFEDGSPMQLNAGMRMNGNASRSPNRGKHNFRLAFRNEYGAGRLQHPLFGEDAPTETFNQIILRGGNGNSWVHPNAPVRQFAMYIRDQWFRDALFAMGYPEALQREVHVYFNGLYFGVHHLFERIEEEWAAERFGGNDQDWEGFRIVGGNRIEVINGTPAEENASMLDSWRTVLDAAQAGDLATVEQYLDLDRFIDYLVLNFHAGNTDWDQNNVRAMRRINPPGKYMFFCHDAERAGLNGLSTGNLNVNSLTHPRNGAEHRPTSINNWLRTNPEYAMRFADRVHKHLFNGGALTPENAQALWEARAQGIRTALKAESARWGDHADANPRTLNDFENGLNRELNIWFPNRTPISINQMRAFNVYPDIEPPVLNQHGGRVSSGFIATMTNESGDIYFTTDGSDPRLPGGSISPVATRINGSVSEVTALEFGATDWKYLDNGIDQGQAWITSGFDDSAWATGTAPLGFGTINGFPFGGPPINPQRHVTVYFRKDLEIENPSLITDVVLSVLSDGGAIVYLNGVEVARDNMPEGAVTFDTLALSDSNVSEGHIDEFAIPSSAFVAGTNIIAVELHNGRVNSSDLGMAIKLDYGQLNPAAGTGPITEATTVKARSYDGNEWSALTEATFITGVPASPENLVISEIYYNPSGTLETAEFIELMNISDSPVSLAGVSFTAGISFTFPDEATLPPGARLLLVADLQAFEAQFGTDLPVAGVYSGRLDNGGEYLILTGGNDLPIADFGYNDRAPWPVEADGDGFSLTLKGPQFNPDGGSPANWRASINPGGSPGESDIIPFQGTTSDDLLAYALVNPEGGLAVSLRELEDNGSLSPFLVATVTGRTATDDARVIVEFSPDLITWESQQTVYLGSNRESNGVTLSHWRAPRPANSADPPRYARLILQTSP
ncbi:MAG: lamin tail domain-containing protein [Akkermansiaceae bacterium]